MSIRPLQFARWAVGCDVHARRMRMYAGVTIKSIEKTGGNMTKHITTVSALAVATALVLGSTAAMSAMPAGGNPYGVPPGGVLKLNKAPSREQTEMICKNLAKSKNLSGSQLTSYLTSCEHS